MKHPWICHHSRKHRGKKVVRIKPAQWRAPDNARIIPIKSDIPDYKDCWQIKKTKKIVT